MRAMEEEETLAGKVVDLAGSSSSVDTEKKPTANLVGFGGPGLCCFVAKHATENSRVEEKGKAIAIVKVQEVDFEVDEELLVMCLGRTYPYKWTWQAKEVSRGRFLVNFPSAARISEVAIYDWVTLRGTHIKINVKKWSDENLAAGKLDTVWEEWEYKNLGWSSRPQKHSYHGKAHYQKLMIYYIYFQVEQVVEEGWPRSEEEYIQDFDEMENTLSHEMGDREAKRQRCDTNEEIDKEPHIQASENTRKALEEREEAIKKQNELDVAALAKKKAVVSSLETNKPPNMRAEGVKDAVINAGGKKTVVGAGNVEETGENEGEYDLDMRHPSEGLDRTGKVDFSRDKGDRAGESDSSLSLNTKIINVQAGKSPNHGKKKQKSVGILEEIEEANGNRFSNRLAPMSDIPIMDRAKNRAMMKNLQSSEGTSLPTIASTSDYCILDIASKVGIELGTSLDM
ncbi:hypothetical protein ACQ4PT_005917 [Festuca glaucescens]